MSDIVFNTTGTYTYTVPNTGTYTIKAVGADGGDGYADNLKGGSGAAITASFSLTAGDELTIFVGDNGEDGMVDARSGGGGGGGSAVILNGRNVLIAAGGGGGAARGQTGFGGVANTNSSAGAGASPRGAGGGGFNATAPDVQAFLGTAGNQVEVTIQGGKPGTLTTIGGSAIGFAEFGYSQGGDGGQGFGGGGGCNGQVPGGGGGYKGGNGSPDNMTGARGGDSFVNLAIPGTVLVSAIPGVDGGSRSDLEGSVTITEPPPVAKIPSADVHTQSAKMDWYQPFLTVWGAINQQNRYRGQVKFDLSSIPSGNVVKATLYLSTTSPGPSGDVIVERLTSDPSVAGKLYNATVGTEKATTNIAATGRYSWDVTSIVQQWRNQSAPNYGFRLRPINDMNFPQTVFNKDLYNATTNPAGPFLEVVVA